jgi:hypothetical protein
MNNLSYALSEIFKHNNPFAWVIGAFMAFALTLIWRNSKNLSTNQVFGLILLVFILVPGLFLVTHYFPIVVMDPKGEQKPIEEPGTTKKDSTPLNPTPIPRPEDKFLGTWENVNSEAHTTYVLEISKDEEIVLVRVRSKCCLLVEASPNSITANRITLNDFKFSENHYSNFSIEKLDAKRLKCKYTALLSDGQLFYVKDTMHKQ